MKKFTAGLSFIVCLVAGILLFIHTPPARPFSAPDKNWAYQDITYVNPAVSTQKNLIALYARKMSGVVQLRLDFLPPIPQSVELSLTSRSAGLSKTLLIHNGLLTHSPDQLQGLLIPSGDNSNADFLIFNVTEPAFVRYPDPLIAQVFVGQSPNSGDWVSYPPTALFSTYPMPTASLLLVFWNSFPAATPSQILRRWDGAHTGPYGQRHGLGELLNQSRAFRVPLTLLDLNRPASFSGLDLIQKIPQIKSGTLSGLLTLPSSAMPGKMGQLSGFFDTFTTWGISPSVLVYQPADRKGLFSPEICKLNQNTACLPLKIEQNEIDRFGLTQTGLLSLASNLNAGPSNSPVLLGGDLPTSPWADSFSAPIAFAYLADHPWIRVWNGYDLELFLQRYPTVTEPDLLPVAPARTGSLYDTPTDVLARDSLGNALPGPLTALAWNTYRDLASRPAAAQLISLRSHYFVEIGQLLLASDWAQHPYPMHQSIQLGPSALYVLSDEGHFLLFDRADGSLLLAVTLANGVPRLLIAPTSIFAVGLSSPDTWTDSGLKSDPAVIPGAFSDDPFPQKKYQTSPLPNGVAFKNEGGMTKSYLLVDNRLQATIYSPDPAKTAIPLVLDPNRRFLPGYRDDLVRLSGKTPIRITSSIPIRQNWFYDSIGLLDLSENPDREYPPDFYLPIPTGKIDLTIPAGKQVQILIDLTPVD